MAQRRQPEHTVSLRAAADNPASQTNEFRLSDARGFVSPLMPTAIQPAAEMMESHIGNHSQSSRGTYASGGSISHYHVATSAKLQIGLPRVPVKYVKIEASSYLICNNKLRCFLETQLKTAKLLFQKEGPKMKFFKNAVGVLKDSLPDPSLLPIMLKFEKHKIRVSECDEETFQQFLVESDRKIFIKGISHNTSESQLRSYLEYFGHVQYLQMTPNRLKNSSFCAVAIFASHQSMLAVIECKTHFINGRRVDVDRYINNTFKKVLDSQAKSSQRIQNDMIDESSMPNRLGISIPPTVIHSRDIKKSPSTRYLCKIVNISQVEASSHEENYRFSICSRKLAYSF